MIKAEAPLTNAFSYVETALWRQAKAHFRTSVASASVGPGDTIRLGEIPRLGSGR